MNERERADALARTIDELIRGSQTKQASFEDEDLRSLLSVAEARRQASIEAGQRAVDHESAVWKRVTERLESHEENQDDGVGVGPPDDELSDIVAARRRVSEDIHELAERHREEVWRRVQERVANRPPKKRGIFSFLQSRTTGDLPLRRGGWGHTGLVLTGDADVDSLLRVALAHRPISHTAHDSGESQHLLRARMRFDPASQVPVAPKPRTGGTSWLRAGAIALLATVGLIFGPMPVTGISASPAVEAARLALDHLAVTETTDPPPSPANEATFSGQETTLANAISRLGLPLVAPPELMDLPRESQRLFSGGMTGTGSETFTVAYGPEGASVLLYEEAAGGADLAIAEGAAVDTLVNGLPATYYEGGWSQAADGSLTWQRDAAQTLIFERNGVRFTVAYSGPHIEPADLAMAAADIR